MTVASHFGSLKCEWLQGSLMEGEYQGAEGDRAVLGDLDLREGELTLIMNQGKTAKNSIAFSGEIAETRVITTPVEIAETRVITSPETAHICVKIASSMESKQGNWGTQAPRRT